MTNLTWYRLEIHALESELPINPLFNEIFTDLYNSFADARIIFDDENYTKDWGNWETINEDMRQFSKKYPGVEFEFTCDDQAGNYWKEWYKNGLAAYAEPQIQLIYPTIEQSMYE